MSNIDFNLYLITDRKLFSTQCSLYLALEDALKAGVKAIQLREKDLTVKEVFEMALWLRNLTREYEAKLFINDRADVALAVNADGIHLSQNSIPVDAVKKITKNNLLIGVSTHNIEEAINAEKAGADFITFGPIYQTTSKPEYKNTTGVDIIRDLKMHISIKILAIGGIKPDKVKEVIDAGADGIALISAILASKNIHETTQEFMRLLK
ncbi:MAG: thiamine phosphate synthase [Nitrospirae bacterium]|nr:thiamine phosphate synthase [Nitrospirota bacterium]